jgi:hypothetical protein
MILVCIRKRVEISILACFLPDVFAPLRETETDRERESLQLFTQDACTWYEAGGDQSSGVCRGLGPSWCPATALGKQQAALESAKITRNGTEGHSRRRKFGLALSYMKRRNTKPQHFLCVFCFFSFFERKTTWRFGPCRSIYS